MSELEWLPNIGKVLASALSAAGIESAAELDRLGSVHAALRLVANGSSVCASRLCALEGAIRCVRWYAIPRHEKDELRARFEWEQRGESE